jgi:uncharacterized OB-fold protein
MMTTKVPPALPRPVAPNLFEMSAAGPCLIGGRDKADGRLVFPLPQGAQAARFEPVRLARSGRLWSWTVQRFRPKSPPYTGLDGGPEAFKPYAVGYVELPGELIVESRIEVEDFGVLKLGLPLELVLQPFTRDAEGRPVATYAFRPVPGQEKTA